MMGLLVVGLLAGVTGCGKSESKTSAATNKKLVIYTNADDEPVAAYKKALDEHGFKDKYVVQVFGTSELGGKLQAEGKKTQADIITMSSYYVEGAQEKSEMFAKLKPTVTPLAETEDYELPMTVQEGAVFFNSKVLKEHDLPAPESIKDLANPIYKGQVSIADIKQSSTTWLMYQALIDTYGEKEAKTIIKGILDNVGDHLEQSGSSPLKKVAAGEVAIGFGLRHQSIKAKETGQPITTIDPAEGTFNSKESIAMIDKGQDSNPEAMKAINVILEFGRKDIIKYYPVALYKGESTDGLDVTKNQKDFSEPLTLELLKKHQSLVTE
jgi:iron(III) transport system permease protein/iron(III) transport system substrate-binding protein